MSTEYRWTHPSEWLADKISSYTSLRDADAITQLADLARALAGLLDGDQIQDLFQAEMDADGYFTPLRKGRQRS